MINSRDLYKIASNLVAANKCEWHNSRHIDSMYGYLHTEPRVHPNVMTAIDWHDVVYDKYPDKEQRSADLFRALASNSDMSREDVNEVCELIMATKTHRLEDARDPLFLKKSQIVRADLHQLASIPQTVLNYSSIMLESMRLYSIDSYTFAVNNKAFMEQLRKTVQYNMFHTDIDHLDFYGEVVKGIDLTIQLSTQIIESEKTV